MATADRFDARGGRHPDGRPAGPGRTIPRCHTGFTTRRRDPARRRADPFGIAGLPTISGALIDQPVHRACHGATVDQVYVSPVEVNSQLVDVTESTRLATITLGGNDLGFTPKLIACIPGGCPNPIVSDGELAVTQLRLTALYKDIRLRMADDGFLFVLSYPQFLPDPDQGEVTDIVSCFGSDVTFSEKDLRDIARATRQVRDMIKRAVDATIDGRVIFVDMLDVFRGHRVCSDDPYSNGYRFPELGGSFHPNPRGHQAIAQRLYPIVSLFY